MSEIISLELDRLEMYKKPSADSFTLKRSSNRARLGTPKLLSLKQQGGQQKLPKSWGKAGLGIC